jgi:hypothetical protein
MILYVVEVINVIVIVIVSWRISCGSDVDELWMEVVWEIRSHQLFMTESARLLSMEMSGSLGIWRPCITENNHRFMVPWITFEWLTGIFPPSFVYPNNGSFILFRIGNSHGSIVTDTQSGTCALYIARFSTHSQCFHTPQSIRRRSFGWYGIHLVATISLRTSPNSLTQLIVYPDSFWEGSLADWPILCITDKFTAHRGSGISKPRSFAVCHLTGSCEWRCGDVHLLLVLGTFSSRARMPRAEIESWPGISESRRLKNWISPNRLRYVYCNFNAAELCWKFGRSIDNYLQICLYILSPIFSGSCAKRKPEAPSSPHSTMQSLNPTCCSLKSMEFFWNWTLKAPVEGRSNENEWPKSLLRAKKKPPLDLPCSGNSSTMNLTFTL